MGKSKTVSVTCAILLVAVFELVDGQSNCINLTQIGESVIYETTILACSILPVSDSHIYLDWYSPYSIPARIEWYGDVVDIYVRDPDKHDCQWDEEKQQTVLTIKNIDIRDDGVWYCEYWGACRDYEIIEVDVTGRLTIVFSPFTRH